MPPPSACLAGVASRIERDFLRWHEFDKSARVASQKIENGTAAEAYLTVMKDRGIDYLFANAGTDFAPLIEAYSKATVNGTKVPKPITVPHENVAMAMAHA